MGGLEREKKEREREREEVVRRRGRRRRVEEREEVEGPTVETAIELFSSAKRGGLQEAI